MSLRIVVSRFLIILMLLVVWSPVNLIVFWVYRKLVQMWAGKFRGDLIEMVTGLEFGFTLGEIMNCPVNILGFPIFNGNISVEKIWEDFQDRVLNQRNLEGKLINQRLKMFWTMCWGFPFWKEERNFQLNNHVRKYDYNGNLSLSKCPSEEELHGKLGPLLKAPWKLGESPWEILVVNNYRGLGQTVVLLRIDHVLSDGWSIFNMWKCLASSGFQYPGFKLAGKLYSTRESLGMILENPGYIVKVLCPRMLPVRKRNLRGDEMEVYVSPQVSVGAIKSIKDHFGVSYAAVITSGITGAIARAFLEDGANLGREFTALMPFPKVDHPEGVCNHMDIAMVHLPLEASSAQDRLLRCEEALKIGKIAMKYILTNLWTTSGIFPSNYNRLLSSFGMKFGSVLISVLPVTLTKDSYNHLDFQQFSFAMGNFGSCGMNALIIGTNNQQRAIFSINKGLFTSEHAASNLGRFFFHEIEILTKRIM